MQCSFGISNILKESSSLSPSVVFLYFFALITEESFLISPCYSLELCIQMDICFLFPLSFASILFSAICKASLDNHFAFLHFFPLGVVLITASCTMLWTSIHSSSATLSIRSNPLKLSLPLYNHKGFDLGHTCLNGLVVFPTIFNLSLNFVIQRSWSEPQSAPGLVFFWLYRASSSFAAKNMINLILVLTIWRCPRVKSSLVLLEEGVCYNQCILLEKTV